MSDCMTQLAERGVSAEAPAVEQGAFRNAMARLAAAVNIVTSVGDEGWCGFTASAVSSVTDAPPTLLVCINRKTQAHKSILSSRVVCVNVVSKPHEALSMAFAGADGNKDMVKRFAAADWTTMVTGAPALKGALAAFDCRVAELIEVGTHDVLICHVLALSAEGVDGDAGGLVYFGRRFHHVL